MVRESWYPKLLSQSRYHKRGRKAYNGSYHAFQVTQMPTTRNHRKVSPKKKQQG
jgi:hypothetical protein